MATKDDVNDLRLELKLWNGGLSVAAVAVPGALVTFLKILGY